MPDGGAHSAAHNDDDRILMATDPTRTPDEPDEPDAVPTPPAEVLVVETVLVERVELPDELREDDDELDDFALLAADPTAGPGLAARLGAEALGTFALVLVVVGTALYDPLSQMGLVGRSLAAGLVLAGVTAALGRVSGGHFNPAVTLASAAAGRTRWIDLPTYWLVQLFGAVAAGAVVFLTIPRALPEAIGAADARGFFAGSANGFDALSPLSTASGGQVTFDLRTALIVELVAGALLAAVYLGAAPRWGARHSAPVAVGLTYAALLLFVGPITGGSLNPVRSTAAALFAGGDALGQLWLFWVAPLVGGAVAGLVHRAFATPAVETFDDDLDDEDDEVVVTR